MARVDGSNLRDGEVGKFYTWTSLLLGENTMETEFDIPNRQDAVDMVAASVVSYSRLGVIIGSLWWMQTIV